MSRQKAAQNQAVEKRTQQRLAARKEAGQRGAETKRRKQMVEAPSQTAPTTPPAVEAQPEAAPKPERPGGPMVTVALRGEPAARLRALAVAQQMSLSKLLVRMLEVFEAQAG